MNKKYIDKIFFTIIVFLIFNNIPKNLQISFIAGPLQSKLVFYPVFVGIIYTLYCQCKYKNVLVNFDKFIKFTIVYLGGICLSTIIGIIDYPYYDLIINAPVVQIEKLQIVIGFLNSFGISTDEKVLTIFWIAIRSLKNIIFEFIYTFCSSYIIYCWYYNNWRKAFNIVIKAVLTSLIIVFAYCGVELFYLTGSEYAKNILITITPYLHVIETQHGWWPRILQPGAVRSVFAEQSFFSIWAAFAFPFLLYKLFVVDKTKSKILFIFITTIFAALIFLTNSRTGAALLCGEFLCLFIYVLYLHNKFIVKNFIISGLCICLAFVLAIGFTNNFMNIKNDVSAESYFESNLSSIASVNARSNGARYSTIYANLKIGFNNPVLGVGRGLVPAYMPENFPEFAHNNREINLWKNYQNDKGILKAPIPSFCIYSLVFAERGGVGLICYLIPWIFLIFKILINLYYYPTRYEHVFLLTALLGALASGFSNTFGANYFYWVLIGLGYAMCFGKENDVKADGTTRYKQEY